MTVRLRILKDRLVLKALGLAVILFGVAYAALHAIISGGIMLYKAYPISTEVMIHVALGVFSVCCFTYCIHGWLERRTDEEHKRQIKSEWEQRHRIG